MVHALLALFSGASLPVLPSLFPSVQPLLLLSAPPLPCSGVPLLLRSPALSSVFQPLLWLSSLALISPFALFPSFPLFPSGSVLPAPFAASPVLLFLSSQTLHGLSSPLLLSLDALLPVSLSLSFLPLPLFSRPPLLLRILFDLGALHHTSLDIHRRPPTGKGRLLHHRIDDVYDLRLLDDPDFSCFGTQDEMAQVVHDLIQKTV